MNETSTDPDFGLTIPTQPDIHFTGPDLVYVGRAIEALDQRHPEWRFTFDAAAQENGKPCWIATHIPSSDRVCVYSLANLEMHLRIADKAYRSLLEEVSPHLPVMSTVIPCHRSCPHQNDQTHHHLFVASAAVDNFHEGSDPANCRTCADAREDGLLS
jgi:hypothetical protein